MHRRSTALLTGPALKRRRARARRAAEAVAALFLAAGILVILLWPTPVDRPLQGRLLQAIHRIQELGLSGFSYTFLEAAANVALFIPLGLLAARLLAPQRWWLAVLLCTVLSGAGELAQELFLPARQSSMRDVVLNSAGALTGVGLAALFRQAGRAGSFRLRRRRG